MCDGISSASILWLYIKKIFPQAKLNFTMHEHKQHGLEDKIEAILEQDYNLIIAPDSSSFDIEYHQQLFERGIDCLVLDHHNAPIDENGHEILPNKQHAIVVNNQLSPRYTNKTLCGAGIVYKFCEVLDDLLCVNYAQDFLDLAALGEIADVMDRTNVETNYIMTEGLKNIKNKGFQTLIENQSFSLKDKAVFPYIGLTPIDIAFYIAPLVNAILRVGTMQEKEVLFYCFIEPEKKFSSTKRGAKLDEIETAAEQTARVGKNAKSRQDKIKDKATELLDFRIQKEELYNNNIILVEIEDEDNIPQELTGLIAMNLVSKYNKPVMVGRRDNYDSIGGSIRSGDNFSGLPSFKVFLENSGLMEFVAGHDLAGGWRMDIKNISKLLEYSNKQLSTNDFEKVYLVDYILDARENNYDLLFQLASHPEYFGNHIDEIKLIIKNISLNNIFIMGANKDSIKINFNNIDYIHFKDLNFIEDLQLNRDKKLAILARPNLNNFNGKVSIQCFIDDYVFEEDNNKYDF